MTTSPARALGPDWQLPAGSTEAIDTNAMWLFGRQASLKTFEVPANIADVAVGLIAQVSAPPQLQAMPDGLLMAGKAGDVHWLVRLVATSATRTHGSASAIDLQQRPTLPALRWQPAGMEVRMDVATRDDTGVVRQQVLTGTSSAPVLHQRLCAALQRQGWRMDRTMVSTPCGPQPLSWPASSFWQHNGSTLALVTDRQASGSSVFVLQTDPANAGLRILPEKLGDWLSHVRIGEVR
ncbi:hypothetical protein FXN63_18360 [Pigmentiphaga aceris]|uniref:Uncharacterized protein n=1 Tax=Pigmentiphaga aceris TaxID=1940612 RepID=A0A5C0B455_9BURK|nr:hypothetical protein [Pigmentiphaga aceris]QEI07581.1 hypothetical protein FXN63_18360 [Pigmentiphaga aceris]